MNKAELVFKAIDVLGHAPQNAKSFDGITCIKDIAYGKLDITVKNCLANDWEVVEE